MSALTASTPPLFRKMLFGLSAFAAALLVVAAAGTVFPSAMPTVSGTVETVIRWVSGISLLDWLTMLQRALILTLAFSTVMLVLSGRKR